MLNRVPYPRKCLQVNVIEQNNYAKFKDMALNAWRLFLPVKLYEIKISDILTNARNSSAWLIMIMGIMFDQFTDYQAFKHLGDHYNYIGTDNSPRQANNREFWNAMGSDDGNA